MTALFIMPFTSQKALIMHRVTQESPHSARTKSHVVPVKSIGHQPVISILFGRTTHTFKYLFSLLCHLTSNVTARCGS